MGKKIIAIIIGGVVVLATIAVLIIGGDFKFSVKPLPSEESEELPKDGTVSPESVEFQTYRSEQSGISIKYPSRWRAVEEGFRDPTVVAQFLSPAKTGVEMVINVRVQVDKTDQPLELQALTDYIIETHRVQFPTGRVVEEGPTTLAGLPGYRFVFADTQQGMDVQWLSVWTTRDDTAYILTYSSTQELYGTLSSVVEEMIQSFQIQ